MVVEECWRCRRTRGGLRGWRFCRRGCRGCCEIGVELIGPWLVQGQKGKIPVRDDRCPENVGEARKTRRSEVPQIKSRPLALYYSQFPIIYTQLQAMKRIHQPTSPEEIHQSSIRPCANRSYSNFLLGHPLLCLGFIFLPPAAKRRPLIDHIPGRPQHPPVILVNCDIIIGTQDIKDVFAHFVFQMARHLLRCPRTLWLLFCGLGPSETSVGPPWNQEMDGGGGRAEVVAQVLGE